jgi:hypothetical protein
MDQQFATPVHGASFGSRIKSRADIKHSPTRVAGAHASKSAAAPKAAPSRKTRRPRCLKLAGLAADGRFRQHYQKLAKISLSLAAAELKPGERVSPVVARDVAEPPPLDSGPCFDR